jgi:hypothetical protein
LGRNFSQDALTKSSGNFGIVRAAQEDSKGLKFSFLPPKKSVHSEKIPMLENFRHLGNFLCLLNSLGHLIKVEESFSFARYA